MSHQPVSDASGRAFLTLLTGHNEWATRVLLNDARQLTAEQFQQRFDIGLGSIHDTLRHLIGAMLRWADRIGGQPVRESIERNPDPRTLDELSGLLTQATADLRHAADALDARDGWSEEMKFIVENGPTYHLTRAAAMMHVLTHGMHHRAQVLNMRRRLGLPALGIDLDVVEWECVQTGQMNADGSVQS